MAELHQIAVNTQPAELAPVAAKPLGANDPGDDPVGQPSTPAAVEPSQEERPAWLPDKFKSAEDMAKAYLELERQRGKPTAVPKTSDTLPAENTPPNTPAGAITEAEMAAYETEFLEKGALSEASYAGLAAKGIPKHIVDNHIEGVTLKAQAQVAQVFDAAGGEEGYREMVEWARTALSPAERAAYDAAVDSKDLGQAVFAAKGLRARYLAEAGQKPTLLQGNSNNGARGVGAAQPYQSVPQMVEDMQNPKYEKDPAFRKMVEQRIAVSNIL